MSAAPTPAQTVERGLAASRADGCVVVVSETSRAELRFALSTLTTNGVARDRSVTVVSVVGESVGTASGSDLAEVVDLVRASEAAARGAEGARDASPLVVGDPEDGWDAPAQEASADVFSRLAPDLGAAFDETRRDGLTLAGYASHDTTTTWVGVSTGLRTRHVQPTGYLELTGRDTATGASTWWGQGTRGWTDLTVDEPVLDGLRQRLTWARRRVDLPAGRYETLLPPSAVADVMLPLLLSAAGRDAAEGRTVWSRPGGVTRVGEQVGVAGLRLRSDPAAPGLACSPRVVATSSGSATSVFDTGLPVGPTDWLDDGRLAALLETRASARERDVPVTPYVDNLLLDGGGTATLEEMVAGTGRGLLLTCLWYLRTVDPQTLLLTGLTRDGVYLVEGGEVVGAVNNFRFNESPVDLLSRVAEVGATTRCLPREWSDWFTRTAMPPLRVPDFAMTSVSAAT